MLTEEKIKKFLDDLRLGKYDTVNYNLEAYGSTDSAALRLKDIGKNVELYLGIYSSKSYKYIPHNWFGLYWESKKKLKTPIPAYVSIAYGFPSKSIQVNISDDLYNSFLAYILEQKEKSKLVEDSNREAAFGL